MSDGPTEGAKSFWLSSLDEALIAVSQASTRLGLWDKDEEIQLLAHKLAKAARDSVCDDTWAAHKYEDSVNGRGLEAWINPELDRFEEKL